MGVDVGRRTESWGLHSATDFLGGLQYILCSHYSNGKFHLCPELFARGRAHDTGDRKYRKIFEPTLAMRDFAGSGGGVLEKIAIPRIPGF